MLCDLEGFSLERIDRYRSAFQVLLLWIILIEEHLSIDTQQIFKDNGRKINQIESLPTGIGWRVVANNFMGVTKQD